MKTALITIISFILVCSALFSCIPSVSALELPSELVAKLHADLKIAHLYERGYGWVGWNSPKSFPLINYPYYKFVQIDLQLDPNWLNTIKGFDVLIMTHDAGVTMQPEQMNVIDAWVKSGGGLILSHNYFTINAGYRTFLAKLGITVEQANIHDKVTIKKDGKMMIDHPITAGVDQVNFSYNTPIVKLESDGDQFIRSPFVALAKKYNAGRIVFLGHGGSLPEELPGIRLMVNIIEWVAGYTPPGWNPAADSIVSTLEKENAELKDQLKTLQSQVSKLTVQLNDSQQQYQSLQKSTSMTASLQGLTYFFMATTIILATAITLYAVKKRRSLK